MKNDMQKLIASLFSLTLLFTLVLTVNAQGRYRGRTYSKADVDRIIHRVEDSSDRLRQAVDRNLDRSRLDGTRREDDINQQVKQLENALDELRSEFDRRDTWRTNPLDLASRLQGERVLEHQGLQLDVVEPGRSGSCVAAVRPGESHLGVASVGRRLEAV